MDENRGAVTVEVCCGSVADALAAAAGGAPRIELNCALELGGLTPSTASVRQVRETTDLEVVAMVRPRAGGFLYDDATWDQALAEARAVVVAGASAVAFGVLDGHGSIDRERTRAMVEALHDLGAQAVFHRAFDLVEDPFEAAETLVEAGVDRLLTSGQAPTAAEGVELLGRLQAGFGDRLPLVAASGIRPDNVAPLIAAGITQVHGSCSKVVDDGAAVGPRVSFAVDEKDGRPVRKAVSSEVVAALRSAVGE